MSINPFYIKNKRFSSSLKGYNKKEVEEFLSSIARVFEELLEKNKNLSEKVLELQKKIDEQKTKNEQIEKILSFAKKKADALIKESKERASFTVKEAEIKAQRIREEEEKKLERIKNEIERLSNQKRLFLSKFKALLRSQVELLKFYEEEGTSSEYPSHPPFLSFLGKIKKVSFEEE